MGICGIISKIPPFDYENRLIGRFRVVNRTIYKIASIYIDDTFGRIRIYSEDILNKRNTCSDIFQIPYGLEEQFCKELVKDSKNIFRLVV